MDIIFIQGLKVDTVIGIYDWERKIRQDVVIDLEMSADINSASKTDNIEQTLNYKSICKRLIEYIQNSEFQLVETLAEKIAHIIVIEFNVDWVKLTLNKGEAVTGAQGVGVIIERTKSSYGYD
jgi:dihydroneopterin aldolase